MTRPISTSVRALDLAGTSSGFATFLAIGGGAALAYVLVSTWLIRLNSGLPDWQVSALCYAGFIYPVYLLHRRFSFAVPTAHRRAFPRYAAVQVAAVLLATLFSFIAHGTLGLPAAPAGLLVAGLTAGVNFVVLRAWAFATA